MITAACIHISNIRLWLLISFNSHQQSFHFLLFSKIRLLSPFFVIRQSSITFRTIMSKFMTSKTLYLGFVKVLNPSSASTLILIIISLKKLSAAIFIASTSPFSASTSTSTSTLSSRI